MALPRSQYVHPDAQPPAGARSYPEGMPQQWHPEHVRPKSDWTFPGFRPYINKAAGVLGLDETRAEDARYLSQARDSWLGKQLQQLAGQLPDVVARSKVGLAREDAPQQLLEHLRLIYLSCVALQEGVAAAILDATSSLELEHPQWLEITDGIRHGSIPVHDLGSSPGDIGNDLGTIQSGGSEGSPRQPHRAKSRDR